MRISEDRRSYPRVRAGDDDLWNVPHGRVSTPLAKHIVAVYTRQSEIEDHCSWRQPAYRTTRSETITETLNLNADIPRVGSAGCLHSRAPGPKSYSLLLIVAFVGVGEDGDAPPAPEAKLGARTIVGRRRRDNCRVDLNNREDMVGL